MIQGVVSLNGLPMIQVQVANQEWAATIDTGFNGDLELPEALRALVNAEYQGPLTFALAGGRQSEKMSISSSFHLMEKSLRQRRRSSLIIRF